MPVKLFTALLTWYPRLWAEEQMAFFRAVSAGTGMKLRDPGAWLKTIERLSDDGRPKRTAARAKTHDDFAVAMAMLGIDVEIHGEPPDDPENTGDRVPEDDNPVEGGA